MPRSRSHCPRPISRDCVAAGSVIPSAARPAGAVPGPVRQVVSVKLTSRNKATGKVKELPHKPAVFPIILRHGRGGGK